MPDGRDVPPALDEAGGSRDEATGATTTTTEPTATTTDEPTTTIAGDATPAPAPVPDPVVVVADEGVVGWWDGAAWRAADDELPTVEAGETYRRVGVGDPVRLVVGGAAGAGCEWVEGSVAIPMEPLDGGIAVSGDHEVLPRPVRRIEPQTEHVEAAREVLAAEGVRDPQPVIAEAAAADLDGDGVDEVVVIAEHGPREDFDATGQNSASAAFVRKLVDGDATNILIGADAPRQRVEADPPYVRYHLRIAALADLNGDGVLDVVLGDRYYEGSGVGIHAFGDDAPWPATTYCGV